MSERSVILLSRCLKNFTASARRINGPFECNTTVYYRRQLIAHRGLSNIVNTRSILGSLAQNRAACYALHSNRDYSRRISNRPASTRQTDLHRENTPDDVITPPDGKAGDVITPPDGQANDKDADNGKSLSIFQRFKKAYKEHGKILVAVHVVTSAMFFGSFYYAATSNLDVVGFLEGLGVSDTLIKPLKGGLGDIAAAYLMYKIATPVRYTVTLGGTKVAIEYLRKKGHIQPVAHEDKLRSLYKEGRDKVKVRTDATKAKLKGRKRH